MSWNEAAIEPCGEAVSNSELFRRLARAMGFSETELFDDDMTVIVDSLPTIDVDDLRRVGHHRVPYPEDGRPFGDGVFPTASGKVEFVSDALVAMGQPALPEFEPSHRDLLTCTRGEVQTFGIIAPHEAPTRWHSPKVDQD